MVISDLSFVIVIAVDNAETSLPPVVNEKWKMENHSVATAPVPDFAGEPPSSILSARRDVNNDDEDCQDDGDEGRQQTKLAERLYDDRLQVEQPNGSQEHQRDDHSQQFPHSFVTKSRKRREAENDEVGNRPDKRQRYTAHGSVLAAQYFRTP